MKNDALKTYPDKITDKTKTKDRHVKLDNR